MNNQDKIQLLENELSCLEFVNHLGDFYDGEMDESLTMKFSDHKESCSFCDEVYRSYDFVVKSASTLRNEMPVGAKVRLRSVLSERLGINLGN